MGRKVPQNLNILLLNNLKSTGCYSLLKKPEKEATDVDHRQSESEEIVTEALPVVQIESGQTKELVFKYSKNDYWAMSEQCSNINS